MKEEVIKEVLDLFISFLEAHSLTKDKNEAVKKQNFEEAIEKIKELRDKL